MITHATDSPRLFFCSALPPPFSHTIALPHHLVLVYRMHTALMTLPPPQLAAASLPPQFNAAAAPPLPLLLPNACMCSCSSCTPVLSLTLHLTTTRSNRCCMQQHHDNHPLPPPPHSRTFRSSAFPLPSPLQIFTSHLLHMIDSHPCASPAQPPHALRAIAAGSEHHDAPAALVSQRVHVGGPCIRPRV